MGEKNHKTLKNAVRIPGLHELSVANTKVFVIQAEKNLLIDTGSGPLPEEVLLFLEQSGFSFETAEQKRLMREGAYNAIIDFLQKRNLTIDAIICTHCHSDHVGNLKRLKETLRVPVAMHALDIAFVEGREEIPAPSFIPDAIRKHFKIEPCKIDQAVTHAEFFCNDLQIIHVPGHTRGSICLLFRNQALIAGDCVVGYHETLPAQAPLELNPPIEMFSMNYQQALTSLTTLLQYQFTAILPSHGASLWERGKDKLCAMLQNLGVRS